MKLKKEQIRIPKINFNQGIEEWRINMLNIIKLNDSSHLIAKVKESLLFIARAKVSGKSEKVITETCNQLGTGFFIDNEGTAIINMHLLKKI